MVGELQENNHLRKTDFLRDENAIQVNLQRIKLIIFGYPEFSSHMYLLPKLMQLSNTANLYCELQKTGMDSRHDSSFSR